MILFFYITENIYSNIDLIFAMAYATHVCMLVYVVSNPVAK